MSKDGFVYLVGNKLDLDKERQVANKDIAQYASDKCIAYTEVCCLPHKKKGIDVVQRMFKYRLTNILKANKALLPANIPSVPAAPKQQETKPLPAPESKPLLLLQQEETSLGKTKSLNEAIAGTVIVGPGTADKEKLAAVAERPPVDPSIDVRQPAEMSPELPPRENSELEMAGLTELQQELGGSREDAPAALEESKEEVEVEEEEKPEPATDEPLAEPAEEPQTDMPRQFAEKSAPEEPCSTSTAKYSHISPTG